MTAGTGGSSWTLEQSKGTTFLAASGQWERAAAAYGKAIESEPDNLKLRCHLSSRLLKSGDLRGYRRAATDLLARFGRAADLMTPRMWPGTSLWPLMRSPTGKLRPPRRDRTVGCTRGVGTVSTPWCRAALCRTLRGSRSADLKRAFRPREVTENPPIDWAFLAMAHHRLGHHEEARRWLDKLLAWRPKEAGGFSWTEVELGILRGETESIVRRELPIPLADDATPSERRPRLRPGGPLRGRPFERPGLEADAGDLGMLAWICAFQAFHGLANWGRSDDRGSGCRTGASTSSGPSASRQDGGTIDRGVPLDDAVDARADALSALADEQVPTLAREHDRTRSALARSSRRRSRGKGSWKSFSRRRRAAIAARPRTARGFRCRASFRPVER